MNSKLRKEKRLYFKNNMDYFISVITREHNYLIWKYLYYLRKEENSKNKIFEYFYRLKKNRLGFKLGILIYKNTCESGLKIWHYGSIIINGNAKIGKNCTLHGQNCIGNNGNDMDAPTIGDNVDIGVGATIIGDVYIANNIKIGAGAIVNKSFYEEGITIVGVPAHKVETGDKHET